MLPLLTQAAQHRGCTSHSCIASAAYSPVLGVQNAHEQVVPKAICGVMKLVASTTWKLQGNHQQMALVISTLPDMLTLTNFTLSLMQDILLHHTIVK